MNFTYAEHDLSGNPAVLKNGLFKGDHLSVKVLLTATGKLNADETNDGVAICLVDGGGSGNFRELCLLLNNDNKGVHADTASIGDRIKVTALKITDGKVTVNYLDRGPKDAMATAPYLNKTVCFRVENDKLIKEN
jgi:hypothetical protein